MKILLTGGSGCLGTELLKINNEIICPTHEEMDVYNVEQVEDYIQKHCPDIVVHAAAMKNNCDIFPIKAICTNIIGTANIAMVCGELKIRMVYISTDYVYGKGDGLFKETDPIFPFNFYADTKFGGECSVKAVPNHLIIRTSFGPDVFPYKQAFIDKWVSKDYVDVIAPLIYEASLSSLRGILNLGTERKTTFDYATRRNKDIEGIEIKDGGFPTPYDTSLSLEKWKNYKLNNKQK
jgi:dTDP-4-dehydrorhamnose reductase